METVLDIFKGCLVLFSLGAKLPISIYFNYHNSDNKNTVNHGRENGIVIVVITCWQKVHLVRTLLQMWRLQI